MQGVQHFRSLMLNVKLTFYFQHYSCYADIKYLGFFFRCRISLCHGCFHSGKGSVPIFIISPNDHNDVNRDLYT